MSIEELWISSRVVPRSRGEIVGILKQVGDEMGADLNDDDASSRSSSSLCCSCCWWVLQKVHCVVTSRYGLV